MAAPRPDFLEDSSDDDNDDDAQSFLERVSAMITALLVNAPSVAPFLTAAVLSSMSKYLLTRSKRDYLATVEQVLQSKELFAAKFGDAAPSNVTKVVINGLKEALNITSSIGIRPYTFTDAENRVYIRVKMTMRDLLAAAYKRRGESEWSWSTAMKWLPTRVVDMLTGNGVGVETFIDSQRFKGVFTLESAALLALLAGGVGAAFLASRYYNKLDVGLLLMNAQTQARAARGLAGVALGLTFWFLPDLVAAAYALAEHALAGAGLSACAHATAIAHVGARLREIGAAPAKRQRYTYLHELEPDAHTR